jgi:acetyltransferase
MDINPLLADGGGVLALDARIRLAPLPPGRAGHARLAILPYPAHLEQRVRWGGGEVCLRPIKPEDARAHQDFFTRLAPEDIHFRVFSAMRELSPAQLARLTQIDYGREMAFIATRAGPDGRPETLGVARVAADPDNVAGEFAVIVRSDLKRQGLGRLLMDCLLQYCRSSGLREVTGTVLTDNTAMLGLARRLSFSSAAAADGTYTLHLQLDHTHKEELT